jgi:predicted ATPase
VLLDRSGERETLDRVVEAVRTGQSRTLVIRGEAGVGKTALLEYLLERSEGCRVIRVAGIQSEMELAFAVIHQLCVPMLDRLERLPKPQRMALTTAFGLTAGPAPDRFLVGLAVLSVLSETAAKQPLVCVVDDAQWVDQASAQALAFAGRRLQAESVALVFALRTVRSEPELAGLPDLVVTCLDDSSGHALLRSVFPALRDERLRDRIIAETGGNPLAILELPKGLTRAELASSALPSSAPGAPTPSPTSPSGGVPTPVPAAPWRAPKDGSGSSAFSTGWSTSGSRRSITAPRAPGSIATNRPGSSAA